MKLLVLLMVAGITVGAALAQQPPVTRPRITGIDHVAFYTTDAEGNRHLYASVLGLSMADPIEGSETQRFLVGQQWIAYSPAPDPDITDRMDHVAFATDNCAALRAFLAAKGVKVPPAIGQLKDGSPSFAVKDPEGNTVEFVERGKSTAKSSADADPVSHRMIHAGYIVRDRAAEDRFFMEILGFRPYWHGGMQDDRTDWVAIQVPDGTDWLEYMLNQPAHPDLYLSGMMNHISLGVSDMKKAQAKLESHGWKEHGDEHYQMGRDGKRQLNVFDPDRSRVELMEFAPAEKPCCSEFQGTHPQE